MISRSNPERLLAARAKSGLRVLLQQLPACLRTSVRQLWRFVPLLCLVAPCSVGALLLNRHAGAAAHWRAAQAALERHDLVQAQAHLQHCLKVRRDPEIHLLAARTARRLGDYQEAVEQLRACARLEGTTPAVVLEQLLLRAQRGELTADVEGALWALVQQNEPDSLLILEALAQGYIYTYRLHNALTCLERWLGRQPDAIQALLWRAQVCQSLHRYQEALRDYRRALALEPAHEGARLQLAVLLAYSGRTDLAAEHFERLAQRGAQNPQVLLGLARCRDAQGRPGEAARLLDALLRQNPKDIPALRERGKIALHLGQEAQAEDWLRHCLALDPSDQEATYLLMLCLGRRGKQAEAQACRARLEQIDADLQRLQTLHRALEQAPGNAALRYEAGIICLRHGQEHEGLRWLMGALQVDPQCRPVQQALADHAGRTSAP